MLGDYPDGSAYDGPGVFAVVSPDRHAYVGQSLNVQHQSRIRMKRDPFRQGRVLLLREVSVADWTKAAVSRLESEFMDAFEAAGFTLTNRSKTGLPRVGSVDGPSSGGKRSGETLRDLRPDHWAEMGRVGGKRGGKASTRLRRRCDDCGLTTSPGALGQHQRGSGHSGWAEAEPVE